MRPPFYRDAPDASTPVTPGPVFDGPTDLWQTAIIGLDRHVPSVDAQDVATGSVLLQVTGLFRGGSWSRRFALQGWGSVQLDLSAFTGLRAEVLDSTLDGVGAFAHFSERGLMGRGRDIGFYPWSIAAGTHGTPWGAFRMRVVTDDPGFAWVGYNAAGGALSVPSPVAAGDVIEVGGPLFSTTIASFSAIWEVSL